MRRSFVTGLVVSVMALAGFTGKAPAAVKIVDELPVSPSSPYTIAPDRTIWSTDAGGTVYHVNPDNGGIIGSFSTGLSANYFPLTIGFYNKRVYVVDTPNLYSWPTNAGQNPPRVTNDVETGERIGSNQGILRVGSGGGASLGLGQNNKAATLNLKDLDSAPYYPQSWFGAGINDPTSQTTAFQGCVFSGGGVVVGGGDSNCGSWLGRSGSDPGQFGYAIDTAFAPGGVFVLEFFDNEVSFVNLGAAGCPCASFSFGGGPGEGAGQLSAPFSIRRDPASGHLLISNVDNRRIDEFTGTGKYVRSFGFGVRTGANKFENCGVGIGPCRAGVPTATETRSYFTQLDLVDGRLYAATPSDGSIQVISLGGSARPKLTLDASPAKVKRGQKTTLTAKLKPCSSGDRARFQRKKGKGYTDLGKPVRFSASCKAAKSVRVRAKSTFRSIALDSAAKKLASSGTVTVKLK